MNDRTQASFDRAQQQYDNMLPPEEDLEREQRRRESEEDEADRGSQMNEEQTKPVMKDFM
jgi:hypothetical protein